MTEINHAAMSGTDAVKAILLRLVLCLSRHTVSKDDNAPLKTVNKVVCLQANGSLMDNGTKVAPTTTGERMVERASATLCQHTTMADVTQYLLEKLASSRRRRSFGEIAEIAMKNTQKYKDHVSTKFSIRKLE